MHPEKFAYQYIFLYTHIFLTQVMNEVSFLDFVKLGREMCLKILKEFELSKYKIITKRNLEKHVQ